MYMSDVVKPKRGGPRSRVDWSETQPYKRITVSKVSPATLMMKLLPKFVVH
jgi:hypothetical protein